MTKWFVCKGEEVLGPLSEDELKSLTSPDDLVWGPSLKDWCLYSEWVNLSAKEAAIAQKKEPSLPAKEEILNFIQKNQSGAQKSQTSNSDKPQKLWYFYINDQNYGPFVKKQLIRELKEMDNPSTALLWSEEMPNWSSVHDCAEINSELNENQRKDLRADIKGQIIISPKDQKSRLISLHNISTSGFKSGAIEGLVVGNTYDVEINSSQLNSSILSTAKLCYLTAARCGFKFVKIQREDQAQIVNYVQAASQQLAA